MMARLLATERKQIFTKSILILRQRLAGTDMSIVGYRK
jgi:hypothetical protein